MVQVLSKMSPIGVTCHEYVHPWTSSCAQASCGLFLHAILGSLRIYATVYLLALLMKGKIPTLNDLLKTTRGILQSTAFLSFTALGYSGFLCLLRKLMGHYNIVTISGLPAFLSSVFAILIERPSRRGLLALYVSNVATETVWNMLLYRKMVHSIKYGQVALFAGSMAILLALFKEGYHQEGKSQPDSMFNILRFVIGPHEEKDYGSKLNEANTFYRQTEQNFLNERGGSGGARYPTPKNSSLAYNLVMQALKMYKKIIHKVKCCDRDPICPHPFSCLYYSLQGSTKIFSVGLALQIALKLCLNIKTIAKSPKKLVNVLFRRNNLDLAAFLGGACGLCRVTMCFLRRWTGKDNGFHALIAGLVGGIAFMKYPDTTISLYVFWKTLQILYNMGIDKGYLPHIPGFTIFLYCLSTGLLFHAALVEPTNLRSSYWKFLHGLSGGRVSVMDRKAMDVWGLETSSGLLEVLKRNKTKPVISWYLVK